MQEHSTVAQGSAEHGKTEMGEKGGRGRGEERRVGRASLTVCVKRETSLLTDPTKAPSVSQRQLGFRLQSTKLLPGFADPDKGNSSLRKQNEMILSVHFVLLDSKKK